MNKRHYEHTLPNIRGSLSNTYKPTKNIDNCITYILNQVKKSGCCGFSDDEIFGMALHYYPK